MTASIIIIIDAYLYFLASAYCYTNGLFSGLKYTVTTWCLLLVTCQSLCIIEAKHCAGRDVSIETLRLQSIKLM